MYQVIITFDKYAGTYQVVLLAKKKLLFIKYWSLESRYRGPIAWVCKRAINLSDKYGCEITDKTGSLTNFKM